MSLVVLQVRRQELLISHQEIVYGWDTSNPITMFDFTITLNIVLTTGEVPHEISPVHEIHLIREEVFDVFPLGRNLHHEHFAALVVRNGTSFDTTQPVFVSLSMQFAIHTREKHVLCILVFSLMTNYFVTVLFIGRSLFLTLIYRSTFYYIVHTTTVYFLQCWF